MVNTAIRFNAKATWPVPENQSLPLLYNEKVANPTHCLWVKIYGTIRKSLHDKQVWKCGAPVGFLLRGGWKNVSAEHVTAPSGFLMSNEIMGWMQLGVNWCLDYYEAFYCKPDQRYQVKRPKLYSTGGVPMKKIMTTEEEYEKYCKKQTQLKSSLDVKVLKKKAADRTKAKVIKALEYTCDLMEEKPDIDMTKLPDNLDDLCKLLVKIRHKWVAEAVEKEGVSKQILFQQIADKERRCHALTTQEKREKLIEDTGFFYVTHPGVRSKGLPVHYQDRGSRDLFFDSVCLLLLARSASHACEVGGL